MPDTNHPPYNITQPRVLHRWLDINSQNGPLQRTQKYISIPPFTLGSTYPESDIVGAFNFASSNAFSLTDISQVPTDLNFQLCIAYANADETVVRYKLGNNPNTHMADYPLYTNKLIKKYFRIEIWSVPGEVPISTETILLYTSVRGTQDYRFGIDGLLVNTSEVVTEFTAPIEAPNTLPLVFPNVLYINED